MEQHETVVILIDALGFELAERHGFWPSCLPERARLQTVLGYSQAALTTILTGCDPSDHGLWMMYAFAGRGSPFSWLGVLPPAVSAERLWLRNAIRWTLSRLYRVRSYYSLYSVPRSILPHLDLPARKKMFALGGAGKATNIFDWMEQCKKRWRIWDYTVPEGKAFDGLERSLEAREADFYLLYTSGLDAIMHSDGTTGEGVRRRLEWYGDRIERIAEKARGGRVVVLGDHGMCDVTDTFDLISRIDSLGLDVPSDFIPFYDSTLARFKVHSRRAAEELPALLSRTGHGRLIDAVELQRFGAFFADGRFGDLIFLADAGALILPSFMGTEPVAAMHGYDPGAPCMDAIVYANRDMGSGSFHLRDMAGSIVTGFEAGDLQ